MLSTFDPAALYAAVEELRGRVSGEAESWAGDVQARMRSEAGWNDRNGPSLTGLNARESLQTDVSDGGTDDGDAIVITAYSDRQSLRPWREWGEGAPVGAFLELGTRFMRSYPTIWPVVSSLAPQLKARVQAVLR